MFETTLTTSSGHEAGNKRTINLQAETKGAKYEARNKQRVIIQAETKQTDFLQAETEGAKHKAGTKQSFILKVESKGVKNTNIPAKPKKQDKEEAINIIKGCKRPIFTDKEGKMKKKTPETRYGGTMMDWPDLDGRHLTTWGDYKPSLLIHNEMSKTVPGRVARHRNKVQDLRDTDKYLQGKPRPGDYTTCQAAHIEDHT